MPQLQGISPFFIVDHLQPSLDFYQTQLGFQVVYTTGGDGPSEDFFGIIARDNAAITDNSGYVVCFGRPRN